VRTKVRIPRLHGTAARLIATGAAVFAALALVALSLIAAASPASASQTASPESSARVSVLASGTVTTAQGQISAELVPVSEATQARTALEQKAVGPAVVPLTSSSCEDQVCIELYGSGLLVEPWVMTASPLLPGDCTFGVFWAPQNTILRYGPDLCNDGNTPAVYIARISYVQFSGPMRVCNTAVGFSGKACENVEE
jgi:hypothetical protein